MNRLYPHPANFHTLAPYVRFVQEIAAGDEYRIPPRIIYDHEIIFVLEGRCEYVIEDRLYPLRAGDVHLMPPHVRHHCRVPAGETFHYFAVHFDPVYMGEELDFSADDVYVKLDYRRLERIPVREELSGRPGVDWGELSFPYVMAARDPHAYAVAFRRMLAAFTAKRHGYPLALRACLLEILVLMAGDSAGEGSREEEHWRPEVSQVIAHMEQHYAEPLHLDALAESVYLAPNYLRSLFKQVTGRSPLEYLTLLRMEKAKELLLAGPPSVYEALSIGEVAARVGYADLHHFSKLFKKLEGLSPKHYRETLRR